MDFQLLALYLALSSFGFIAQLFQRLVDIRKTLDASMHLGQYLKTWPYATALALMGSWTGVALLLAGDQANAATAILAGYAGNAVFDSARSKDL